MLISEEFALRPDGRDTFTVAAIAARAAAARVRLDSVLLGRELVDASDYPSVAIASARPGISGAGFEISLTVWAALCCESLERRTAHSIAWSRSYQATT